MTEQRNPYDPPPQIVDKWREERNGYRRRDYLEDRKTDWLNVFYKWIFPIFYVKMFIVGAAISWPVIRRAYEEYHWYEHWAVVISNGFTIAVLACIYYYFIGPLRDVRRDD